MTAAIGALAALNVAVLIWLLWAVYGVRDDVRDMREEQKKMVTQPTLDEWLRDHPDRPYRDDPPIGRPLSPP